MPDSDMKNLPELRSYLNVHQYLQDLYAFLKKTRETFSYEIWSQEIGSRSRSYLRMVVMGKRSITDHFTDVFCKYMQYDPLDKTYFEVLVLYSQSRSQEQRKAYSKRLIDILNTGQSRKEIENHFEFLATPYLPRLQTLLSFDDIKKTPEALAPVMQVSANKLREGLETLRSLGLAEEKNGEWYSKQRLLKVPEHFGSAALQQYHSESLREAIQAQNAPITQRRFRSLLVPMTPEEYQSYLAELEEFVQQVLFKYQSDELQGRRLYQVNYNLFSTTELPPGKAIETS